MLFHEEEKATFLPLYSFWDEHEMGDPGYDEFHVIDADVEEVLADGPNKEGSRHADGTPFWSLSITYRHFPARVETQAGKVVYQR